jgi:hypothetical protein
VTSVVTVSSNAVEVEAVVARPRRHLRLVE